MKFQFSKLSRHVFLWDTRQTKNVKLPVTEAAHFTLTTLGFFLPYCTGSLWDRDGKTFFLAETSLTQVQALLSLSYDDVAELSLVNLTYKKVVVVFEMVFSLYFEIWEEMNIIPLVNEIIEMGPLWEGKNYLKDLEKEVCYQLGLDLSNEVLCFSVGQRTLWPIKLWG